MLRAIANMPYGALVSNRLQSKVGFEFHTPRPVTLADVAHYLHTLAEVLREHVEDCNSEHEELVQLRRDVDGLRRVFGVALERQCCSSATPEK